MYSTCRTWMDRKDVMRFLRANLLLFFSCVLYWGTLTRRSFVPENFRAKEYTWTLNKCRNLRGCWRLGQRCRQLLLIVQLGFFQDYCLTKRIWQGQDNLKICLNKCLRFFLYCFVIVFLNVIKISLRHVLQQNSNLSWVYSKFLALGELITFYTKTVSLKPLLK